MFFYLIYAGLLFFDFRYRLALSLLIFGILCMAGNHAGVSAAQSVPAFYGESADI